MYKLLTTGADTLPSPVCPFPIFSKKAASELEDAERLKRFFRLKFENQDNTIIIIVAKNYSTNTVYLYSEKKSTKLINE